MDTGHGRVSPSPTSPGVFVFVFVLGHGRVPPSPHHLVDWHEAASTAANGDKVITIVIVCSSREIIFLFNSRPQKKEYQGVATSKLLYVPDITDDGHYLTCRSPRIISSRLIKIEAKNILSNHIISHHHRVLAEGAMEESLEDTWEIKVLCE